MNTTPQPPTEARAVWAVTYTDSGPQGACCQCMSITCNWNRVYLFDSEQEADSFCRQQIKEASVNGRKKPRWDIAQKVFAANNHRTTPTTREVLEEVLERFKHVAGDFCPASTNALETVVESIAKQLAKAGLGKGGL